MQKIVIASNNKHKIKEISALIPKDLQIISLEEIGCFDDIPEEADTLEGNAFQKASYIFNKYKVACFADDTGLEVDTLNGKPGVYSARYSEDTDPEIPKERRSEANIMKLLHELRNKPNRKAAFRTVICFMEETGVTHYFEGKIEGKILEEKKGIEGFGYDPVFVPDGYEQTFAEMSLEIKNKISHRAIATNKFLSFLRST